MKFTIPITFDIDPFEWMQEYDLSSESSAVHDISRIFTEAGMDGAIAEALTAQWPMMREAATITVGPVEVST